MYSTITNSVDYIFILSRNAGLGAGVLAVAGATTLIL